MNAHNAPRNLQKQRNVAVKKEIAKIKKLRKNGAPVFFLGDLNEKKTVFCKVRKQDRPALAARRQLLEEEGLQAPARDAGRLAVRVQGRRVHELLDVHLAAEAVDHRPHRRAGGYCSGSMTQERVDRTGLWLPTVGSGESCAAVFDGRVIWRFDAPSREDGFVALAGHAQALARGALAPGRRDG